MNRRSFIAALVGTPFAIAGAAQLSTPESAAIDCRWARNVYLTPLRTVANGSARFFAPDGKELLPAVAASYSA